MSRRYFICSDLHLEFHLKAEKEFWSKFPTHFDSEGKNVCICAGDLTVFSLPMPTVIRHFTSLCERFDKVLYVPGNHEYYGCSPELVAGRLAEVEAHLTPMLTVLRSFAPYTYEGQRFIGDTMWFSDRPEAHIYKKTINDSFQIKGLYPWAFNQSTSFLTFITNEMKEDDIVITHHIPNDQDTRPMWKSSTTQPFFVNKDVDLYCRVVKTTKPKAWIYGHTHDRHDYTLGGTRYICNPLGYPSEYCGNLNSIEPVIYEI